MSRACLCTELSNHPSLSWGGGCSAIENDQPEQDGGLTTFLSLAAGQSGKECFFPGCAAIVAILVARQVNAAMNRGPLRRCTAPH